MSLRSAAKHRDDDMLPDEQEQTVDILLSHSRGLVIIQSLSQMVIDTLVYLKESDYAKKEGLEKAAEKYGLDVIYTPEVAPDEAIPGVGLRTLVNEYAMKNGIGSIPDVVKSNKSYFILQVTDVVPEKFDSFRQAKNYVKGKILAEAYRQKRKELASIALQKISSGEPFDKVAEDVGAIYDTTGWIGAFDPIGNYGYIPWINGTLLGLRTPGSISNVIEDDRGNFYIVQK